MARIRTVKPEFWQHPKVCKVSRDSRLLFLGLLNEADDEGRMRYSAKRLAGVVFAEDDDVDAHWIDEHVAELQGARLVTVYCIDGAAFLEVDGFTEHQKINRPTPSRLPHSPLSDPSVSPLALVTEPSLGEGNREGNGKEQGVSAPNDAPLTPRGCRVPVPFVVHEGLMDWAQSEIPGFDYDRETKRFMDYWKGVSGQKGVKLDWDATWRRWMRDEAKKVGIG